MNRQLLSQNVQALRAKGNLTQNEVADRAGISRQTYINVETGKGANPQKTTILALANFFKVSATQLTGDSDFAFYTSNLLEEPEAEYRQRSYEEVIRENEVLKGKLSNIFKYVRDLKVDIQKIERECVFTN